MAANFSETAYNVSEGWQFAHIFAHTGNLQHLRETQIPTTVLQSELCM